MNIRKIVCAKQHSSCSLKKRKGEVERFRKKKRISVNIDVAMARCLAVSLFVARRAPQALYAKKAGCHMTVAEGHFGTCDTRA